MSNRPSRIAIVGGGISGCAAAYYAREAFGDECEIVVFERDNFPGGRVRTIFLDGHDVEMGAMLLHESYRNILGFVDEFGFDLYTMDEKYQPLGVWVGDGFVTIERSLGAVVRLARRYGLDPFRVRRYVAAVLGRIRELYDPLDGGRHFETTESMLDSVGLEGLTRLTGREYFRDRDVGTRILDELVRGLNRAVHGGTDRTALTTMFSLGATMTAGKIYAVRGGNDRLCRALLEAADATVLTSTPVSSIDSDGGTVDVGSPRSFDPFDATIVATPLENTEIDVSGPDGAVDVPQRDIYRSDMDYVEGEIDPGAFAGQVPPRFTVFGAERESGITSLKRVGDDLYQIMAPTVDDALLDEMFRTWSYRKQHHWRCWPELTPDVERPPFELTDDVYYPSAIESCYTTVELMTIGAQNVVNYAANESA